MRSFALDIETMGTEPESALIAVGMVEFHHDEDNEAGDGPRIDREFYVPIHLATVGGEIDAATVLWWMREDLMMARRKWMFSAMPARDALQAMIDWIKVGGNGDDVLIYAKGPQFDCTIVRQTLKRHGFECPWHFRNERDTRTMQAMYRSIKPPEFVGIPHFALDDALHEARCVWNLWRSLNAA